MCVFVLRHLAGNQSINKSLSFSMVVEMSLFLEGWT